MYNSFGIHCHLCYKYIAQNAHYSMLCLFYRPRPCICRYMPIIIKICTRTIMYFTNCGHCQAFNADFMLNGPRINKIWFSPRFYNDMARFAFIVLRLNSIRTSCAETWTNSPTSLTDIHIPIFLSCAMT